MTNSYKNSSSSAFLSDKTFVLSRAMTKVIDNNGWFYAAFYKN